jgi:RNA recognition motif-containing protein
MAGKEDGRIFVGGLSFHTDERKLSDAFRRFGKVVDAQVSEPSPRCPVLSAAYVSAVILAMKLVDLCLC